MNESLPIPGRPPGAPTTAPVAGAAIPGVGASPAAGTPASPSATQSVPLFGGFRGGRRRLDGLPAGSPEAKAADAAKNAERMRRARERERAAQPPDALPSAEGTPEPGAALAGAEGPAPGGDLGAVPVAGPVPWRAETLKPLCEQGLAFWEEWNISQAAKIMKKAGLPAAVIAKVEKDGRFPALAKKGVETSAPPLLARAMNQTGISSEHQDSLILGGALLALFQHQKSFLSDVETLIAEAAPKEQGNGGKA